MSRTAQIEINFEPGLTEQYGSLMDVIRGAYYASKRPKKVIAAECDMSPSELNRRLSEHDDLPFRVEDLPYLMTAMSDSSSMILDWLVEAYGLDHDYKHRRAVDFINNNGSALLAALTTLMDDSQAD